MSLACLRKVIAVAVLGLVSSAVAGAQQTQRATITGRVTDQESGQPIQDVRVFVLGTTLGAATDQEGRYTIRGAPPGTVEVRAIRIGYQESKKPVSLTAGETGTLDFALAKAALQLQEVVSTATGDARKVELGNSIAQVDVAKLTERAPITQMSDVLQARTPGVSVNQGTQTGGGAKIRIRGQGSLNLNNDPIYIIDGVRATSTVNASNPNATNNTLNQASNIFTGGVQPSRVQDLNPEEIESIEIVKGPSAATLYGTDAANGVVVIKTKRGRAGPARWTTYAEYGQLKDLNDYPTAYTLAGKNAAGAAATCVLRTVALGTCTVDSVRTQNNFTDPETTPLGTGNRGQYGLQVSGGSEAVRYFVSGEFEEETSPVTLPRFEKDRLLTEGFSLREEWMHPNNLKKRSFRANLNATLSPKIDVAVSTGYINLDQRYHLESNATGGLGSQIFGGPGHKLNGNVSGVGNPLRGYRAFTPGQLFQEFTGQKVNRFLGSVNVNWRPSSWLSNRANIGTDYTQQNDLDFLRNGQGAPLTSTYRDGFRDDSRTATTNLSFDLGSTANFQPRTWLNSKTTIGAQYISQASDLSEAYGEQLPPGATDLDDAVTHDGTEETTTQKTLGFFVEEALAFNDRLYVTGALRTDQNSAFGTNFQQVYYPKASISWIASQESFFPRPGWLDEFRLRAAYGASGTQPGPNDGLRSFETTSVNYKAEDISGLQFLAIGNKDLKPERATELETGFDARFLQSRVNLELTYYHKRTKDALINAIVPPSYGAAINVRSNLGAVRNVGWEVLLNSQVIDNQQLGWDVTVTGSTNKNTLLSLGGLPPVVGTLTRAQVGYPLFGFWARQITWEDKNGDGILVGDTASSKTEVFVADSNTYIGSSAPTRLATLSSGVEFLHRQLRLSALADYKGGHRLYNNTERIRCQSRRNCKGMNDQNAPLWEQARTVALLDIPGKSTLAGYFEKADFVRLREMSLTYSPSGDLAARLFKARTASFTFSARNLAVWTDYSGVDPEIDRLAATGTEVPEEFQTLGPNSYFLFRVNLGF
jgi:TonB-linked SusC/RagA family outer membrane protein